MTAPPFGLICRDCATRTEPGTLNYQCAACGGELVVRYHESRTGLGASGRSNSSGGLGASGGLNSSGGLGAPGGRAGVWRYADRLPLLDPAHIVSLGEGGTPLVSLAAGTLGVASVAVKCEHLNPTGSFKDRIATVALSIARERGLAGCVGTSSGNGGAAAAAYSARAGLSCSLFALADTAEQKLLQIRAFGATVHLVQGLGHDAAATDTAARTIAALAAEHGLMPILTGGRFSPEAMEGATTIAYEILDEAPHTTVVYAPVGGGGLVSAIGRGLSTAGAATRVVAVQPAGCPTLRAALDGDHSGLSGPCTTGVSGLQVAILFDGRGAVAAVRDSGGHLTEVTDAEIHAAQRGLAEAGILVEPAGATAYAGALADAAAGRLGPHDQVVLLATGAGYKDSTALARLAGDGPVPRITANQIREAIADAARVT